MPTYKVKYQGQIYSIPWSGPKPTKDEMFGLIQSKQRDTNSRWRPPKPPSPIDEPLPSPTGGKDIELPNENDWHAEIKHDRPLGYVPPQEKPTPALGKPSFMERAGKGLVERTTRSAPDYTSSYLPDIGEAAPDAGYGERTARWAYKKLAQPAISPMGIGAASFGHVAPQVAGAVFGGMGAYEYPQALWKASQDPTLENVLDVGSAQLMGLGLLTTPTIASALSERYVPKPFRPVQFAEYPTQETPFQSPLPTPDVIYGRQGLPERKLLTGEVPPYTPGPLREPLEPSGPDMFDYVEKIRGTNAQPIGYKKTSIPSKPTPIVDTNPAETIRRNEPLPEFIPDSVLEASVGGADQFMNNINPALGRETDPFTEGVTTRINDMIPEPTGLPDFVPIGDEVRFNATREQPAPIKTPEEVAYENLLAKGGREPSALPPIPDTPINENVVPRASSPVDRAVAAIQTETPKSEREIALERLANYPKPSEPPPPSTDITRNLYSYFPTNTLNYHGADVRFEKANNGRFNLVTKGGNSVIEGLTPDEAHALINDRILLGGTEIQAEIPNVPRITSREIAQQAEIARQPEALTDFINEPSAAAKIEAAVNPDARLEANVTESKIKPVDELLNSLRVTKTRKEASALLKGVDKATLDELNNRSVNGGLAGVAHAQDAISKAVREAEFASTPKTTPVKQELPEPSSAAPDKIISQGKDGRWFGSEKGKVGFQVFSDEASAKAWQAGTTAKEALPELPEPFAKTTESPNAKIEESRNKPGEWVKEEIPDEVLQKRHVTDETGTTWTAEPYRPSGDKSGGFLWRVLKDGKPVQEGMDMFKGAQIYINKQLESAKGETLPPPTVSSEPVLPEPNAPLVTKAPSTEGLTPETLYDQLHKNNAPDQAYKGLLTKEERTKLKKGETWKSRAAVKLGKEVPAVKVETPKVVEQPKPKVEEGEAPTRLVSQGKNGTWYGNERGSVEIKTFATEAEAKAWQETGKGGKAFEIPKPKTPEEEHATPAPPKLVKGGRVPEFNKPVSEIHSMEDRLAFQNAERAAAQHELTQARTEPEIKAARERVNLAARINPNFEGPRYRVIGPNGRFTEVNDLGDALGVQRRHPEMEVYDKLQGKNIQIAGQPYVPVSERFAKSEVLAAKSPKLQAMREAAERKSSTVAGNKETATDRPFVQEGGQVKKKTWAKGEGGWIGSKPVKDKVIEVLDNAPSEIKDVVDKAKADIDKVSENPAASVFARSFEAAKEAMKTTKKIVNLAAMSIDTELPRMGLAGKSIWRLIVERDHELRRANAKPAEILQKFLKLSEDEQSNFYDYYENKAQPMNDKVLELANEWSKIEKDIGKRAVDVELEMRQQARVNGKKKFIRVPFKPETNYVPHRLPPEYLKSKPSFIENMMKNEGMTRQEATRAYNLALANRGDIMTAAQYRRQGGKGMQGVGYVKDVATLINHVEQMNKAILDAKYFGKRGRLLSDLIELTPDPTWTNQLVNEHLGMNVKGPVEKKLKIFNDAVRTFQSTVHLQRFAINNVIGGNINTWLHTPSKIFLETVLKGIKKDSELYNFADEAGARWNVFRGIAEGIGNNVTMKAYGGNWSENLNRTIAAGAGRGYARQLFAELKKNPNNKFQRNALENLLLRDADVILRQDALTPQQELLAGGRHAEVTQGLNLPRRMPLAWSNEWTQVPLIFKKYAFQQAKELNNAIKANPKILVKLGLLSQLSGEMIGAVRSGTVGGVRAAVSGRNPLTEIAQDEKDRTEYVGRYTKNIPVFGESISKNWLVNRFVGNMMEGWTLGLMADLAQSAAGGPDSFSRLLLGPFYSQMKDLIGNVTTVNPKGVGREVLRSLPIPYVGGTGIQQAVLPTQFQKNKQKSRMFSGRVPRSYSGGRSYRSYE